MAGTAGATGAFVGTPAEVALVRMSADGRLPKGYHFDHLETFCLRYMKIMSLFRSIFEIYHFP